VEWARRAECLPIYCGWTHAFGVTEDGTFLMFEHDPSPGAQPEESALLDLRWQNVASTSA
jgi:hypothetical protein